MATESIQDIKRRIKSVTSTEHITNAMKLVSAGKLRKAKAIFEKTNEKNGKPWVIVQKSVKGKGVSFMEDKASWHGSAPNDEQYAQAMEELKAQLID